MRPLLTFVVRVIWVFFRQKNKIKFFNNIRNDHSMRIFQPKGVVIVSPDVAFGSPVI